MFLALRVIVVLTVEGRAPRRSDPTRDGGFSDLAQHLAGRTATVVQGVLYCFRPRVVVLEMWGGFFQKESGAAAAAAL